MVESFSAVVSSPGAAGVIAKSRWSCQYALNGAAVFLDGALARRRCRWRASWWFPWLRITRSWFGFSAEVTSRDAASVVGPGSGKSLLLPSPQQRAIWLVALLGMEVLEVVDQGLDLWVAGKSSPAG